jgi:biotin operon repressor
MTDTPNHDPQWYLTSSRGTVLFHIAANPECTIDQIADALCLTRRTVWANIGDLRRAGMVHVRKDGRRHHYTVNLDAPFFHPTIRGYSLRRVLAHLAECARSTQREEPAVQHVRQAVG